MAPKRTKEVEMQCALRFDELCTAQSSVECTVHSSVIILLVKGTHSTARLSLLTVVEGGMGRGRKTGVSCRSRFACTWQVLSIFESDQHARKDSRLQIHKMEVAYSALSCADTSIFVLLLKI
jgi:hypothetical protein